ncbi:MAG: hypothetical protein KDI69_03615, partial [Xanthomonadales bacterium]|nr:hypothetical protein [Xanthomonadales bacterium]
VKHAWLTTNQQCDSSPGNYHILGRGCVDTYSQSNNDEISDLGPRSEIIPAKGQWGRCGSVYDRDCDGNDDGLSTPCSNIGGGGEGCRNWAFRLAVHEDEINPALHPGARFWVESWYVVRDDVNIYNTMQTRAVSFSQDAGTWTSADGASDDPTVGLKLGPAIDRWLARGTATGTQRSSDVDTDQGRGRIAVKVTDLGNGRWRYDYAVANFDFAVAQTQGLEPNLRVLSNAGFVSFEIQTSQAQALQNPVFSDGDRSPDNDWQGVAAPSRFRWSGSSLGGSRRAGNLADGNALNWGSVYGFSIEASTAPVTGTVRLQDAAGQIHTLNSLVPATSEIEHVYGNGFEVDSGD